MPNTITGSIGVFGIIPNIKGFLNHKLGVTVDGVKTAKHADIGTISRPLTDAEHAIFQSNVDKTYHTFISHVGDGRDMSTGRVDSIGQGRVWSGTDAINIGLIDKFGGLDSAIAEAARMAGISDYSRKVLPERKDPFEKILEDFGASVSTQLVKFQLGDDQELLEQFEKVREIKNMKGIQMRVPYALDVQ